MQVEFLAGSLVTRLSDETDVRPTPNATARHDSTVANQRSTPEAKAMNPPSGTPVTNASYSPTNRVAFALAAIAKASRTEGTRQIKR